MAAGVAEEYLKIHTDCVAVHFGVSVNLPGHSVVVLLQ